MSQYVVLVRADHVSEAKGFSPLFAITTASDPYRALEALNYHSPIPVYLEWSVLSQGRTDDLLKTLEIKFRPVLDHGYWYRLDGHALMLIKSISVANLTEVSGLIKRDLKKPEMTEAAYRELIQAQLEKASALL